MSYRPNVIDWQVFSVTPETGIVYVSRPETLMRLQNENITVSVYVTFTNHTLHQQQQQRYNHLDDDDDDGRGGQSESPPPRSLSVANISVHVQRLETDYNATSTNQREILSPVFSLPRDAR